MVYCRLLPCPQRRGYYRERRHCCIPVPLRDIILVEWYFNTDLETSEGISRGEDIAVAITAASL